MLPWVCSVIDHIVRRNVVKTSVTHEPATSLFLPHFDVICDLLLNKRTAMQHGIYLININTVIRKL